ncbi:MAG: segregation and condensation protein A [Candidatus Spyradocola sp.]|jgi:segregation and condensation protein A
MAYVVQLKDFEGPLDLLLHLIGRAKIRIEDIFVSEITEQYLASVQDLSGLDMDAASEFLQMAATLMEIKSRALLPKPPKDEDEEDPKEELLRRLEEYRQIKEASKALRIYEAEAAEMVSRLPMEIVTDARVELRSLSLRALQEALLRVLLRAERNEVAPPPPRQIPRDDFTIGECMLRVLHRVLVYGQVEFAELFPADATRAEIVTTFLALLELLKANRVTLRQEDIYAPIVIAEGKGEET